MVKAVQTFKIFAKKGPEGEQICRGRGSKKKIPEKREEERVCGSVDVMNSEFFFIYSMYRELCSSQSVLRRRRCHNVSIPFLFFVFLFLFCFAFLVVLCLCICHGLCQSSLFSSDVPFILFLVLVNKD